MASTAGAIKAGRAFVELFVEDNAAYRQLDKFGNKFQSWGGWLKKAGAVAGAAGSAVLGPMLASLKEVVGRANDFQLLADRLGEGVGAVSTLAGGFERAGVSADRFGGMIQGLKLRVAQATRAHGYLLDDLRSMGPASQLAGRTTREQLNAVADAIARIPDEMNQLDAAEQLGLADLLPQLKKGKAGIDELFASGGAGALTDEQGRQSVAVTKAAREAWHDFKDTIRQVGLALLPTAAGIADLKARFTAGLAVVRAWISENRGAIVTVAAVGAGLIAAGVIVAGLGVTFVVVGKAILLTLAAVKLALGILFAPLLGLGAGLAALAAGGLYLFATRTESGREAVEGFKASLQGVADRAKTAFAGVAEAVQSGDWTRAFRIGLAYIKAEWATFNVYLVRGWNWFKSVFVDTWYKVVAGLKLGLNEIGAFVLTNTVGRLRQALDLMAKMVEKLPGGKRIAASIRSGASNLMSTEEIEAGRKSNEDRILNEERDRQREADNERGFALIDAEAARDNARISLNDLLRPRAVAGGGSTGGMGGGLEEMFAGIGVGLRNSILQAAGGGLYGPARMGDAVKGVTGGNSASTIGRQLGYGDTIPQQQLDATRGLLTVASGNLPMMARDLNTLAQRGRVGQ
ncbi:MAG TPA: hypothetical protein VD866_29810 [Urbifossiella sp.]|nr:hypothetical protein [Urbifossiella sp.]